LQTKPWDGSGSPPQIRDEIAGVLRHCQGLVEITEEVQQRAEALSRKFRTLMTQADAAAERARKLR
jgi:hypothetical protein